MLVPDEAAHGSEIIPLTIGGMERQTLRDLVHRFNDHGPDGLCNVHAGGIAPRLSAEKLAEFAAIVEAGPVLATSHDPCLSIASIDVRFR